MTIYEIAAEAGVAISTVSRVLNGGKCSAETKEKVEAVMKRQGYVPNAIARGLAVSSMKTVAIVMVDIRVGHYAHTSYVLEQEFRAKGYDVLLCNTGSSIQSIRSYLHSIAARSIDGIVLVGSVFDCIETEKDLVDILTSTPTVLANGKMKLDGVVSISVDDFHGIGLAVEHLVNKGRKHILYAQDLFTSSAEEKREGYLCAMAQAGLNPNVQTCEYGLDGGAELIERLIANGTQFNAIVFGEDMTAAGALKALKRNGILVPSSVSITGYNNLEFATAMETELTSVDNKCYQLAELCADRLLKMMMRQETSSFTIQPELVQRMSS